MKIDVLSDGHLVQPVNFVLGDAPADEVKLLFSKYNLPSDVMKPSCNLTLVREGDKTILFDVGSGPNFMPTAGKISDALDAINLDASEVTHVLFTHAHPDHLWGLLDDFDDPVFPNAEYMISRKEWDYWINPETVNSIGEARQSFAAGAMRYLKVIEDKITRFDMDEEVLPGIRAMDTSGHTPGHVSFELGSGSESIVVVGDALTNAIFSFEKPDWRIGADQNPEMAVVARNRLLDQLVGDKMQMIGYHIPYPGIGRVERSANAYRFVAD
ncbi:MAG: MBL fold metallo-hydrolase [Hyphomicrobiales bacterium]|nr:MBL fold metallo-hydrolase [Hyphomicrobiales bacterium]